MRRHFTPIILEFKIDSFSSEGHGIGTVPYPEGKISGVEVPFAIPGDRVKAALLKRKKGRYQSRLEEIVEPSPDRIKPLCVHFGSCGGCRWQQISYSYQLALKEQSIRRLFAPYITENVTFYPIIPCDPPWQYRNKMEFSFSGDKAKNRYLGLILQGSRGKVFNLQECHLTYSWFQEGVKAVKNWWDKSPAIDAYHQNSNTGSLRTLMMREGRRTGDRMVMLTVSGNPDYALHKKDLDGFVLALREAIEPPDPEKKLSIFMRIQQIAKGKPTSFYEMHLYGPDHIRETLYQHGKPFHFKISPTAFFQPNTEQAEKLYARALDLIKIPPQGVVYDLYCGTGTLGICAASEASEVLGIELSPESVLDARENIKLNSLSNVTIYKGDVGKILGQLEEKANGKRPDVVMVDPPRVGLDPAALKHILALKARQILYISCNPVSQAANLDVLTKGGYVVTSIQPVDQFPQTVHVENIVTLKAE